MNITLENVLDIHRAKEAWGRVRQNKGSAGIDGVTVREVDGAFLELWAAVADGVRKGTYSPEPVRRVNIPKPHGGERALGIPCVLDRVLAQALNLLLIPMWEDEFSPMSFAYRPGRTPMQALRRACDHISESQPWLLHLDIEDFFGSVSHSLVLRLLRRKIDDSRLVDLVGKMMSAGVFHNELVTNAEMGLHQGSPLSPLLANIVLHELDSWMHERNVAFVRYADDLLVCLSDEIKAHTLLPEIVSRLAELGLRLNDRKTRSLPADEIAYLGFSFRVTKSGAQLLISQDSILRMQSTLMGLIQSQKLFGAESCARECARLLRSWKEYYGKCDDFSQFEALYEYTRESLIQAFPSNLSSGDPFTIATLQSWGLSALDSARSDGRPCNYDGSFSSQVDWRSSARIALKRLLRQRIVRFRMNLGRRKNKSIRVQSYSLIICGHEFRFFL